jgi:peptidoglycan/LPS O-acetylase OafA/YrhL
MTDTNLWLAAVAVSVGVSIALATLSYRFLEAPVIGWARGLETRAPRREALQPV